MICDKCRKGNVIVVRWLRRCDYCGYNFGHISKSKKKKVVKKVVRIVKPQPIETGEQLQLWDNKEFDFAGNYVGPYQPKGAKTT